WALATRFQADRDLVTGEGFRAIPLDPSLDGRRTGAKAGFDLTLPFGSRGRLDHTVPETPQPPPAAPRAAHVREALAAGPLFFGEIAAALGSDDGREIVRALAELREAGALARTEDGRYTLSAAVPRP